MGRTRAVARGPARKPGPRPQARDDPLSALALYTRSISFLASKEMPMIPEMLTEMRTQAELIRGLSPAYAAAAAAMTPAWSAVEVGLSGLLGRAAVVHRADGMILVEGVTGHPVVTFVQVLRHRLEVTIVSGGRDYSFRTPLTPIWSLDRIEAAVRYVVHQIRIVKFWATLFALEECDGE